MLRGPSHCWRVESPDATPPPHPPQPPTLLETMVETRTFVGSYVGESKHQQPGFLIPVVPIFVAPIHSRPGASPSIPGSTWGPDGRKIQDLVLTLQNAAKWRPFCEFGTVPSLLSLSLTWKLPEVRSCKWNQVFPTNPGSFHGIV